MQEFPCRIPTTFFFFFPGLHLCHRYIKQANTAKQRERSQPPGKAASEIPGLPNGLEETSGLPGLTMAVVGAFVAVLTDSEQHLSAQTLPCSIRSPNIAALS